MDFSPPQRYMTFIALAISMFASILRIFRVYRQHSNSVQPLEARQPLSVKFRLGFLALAISQITISLGAGIGFVILTCLKSGVWAVYLLSSIVLSSMVAQVSKPKTWKSGSTVANSCSVCGRAALGIHISVLSTRLCQSSAWRLVWASLLEVSPSDPKTQRQAAFCFRYLRCYSASG